jgi:hypothetical protein
MISHFAEALFFTCSALLTVTAATVASTPSSDDVRAAVMWSVMPLVGAMLSSAMAFFLSATPVDRRQAFGRCLGALVFGVCIPRLILVLKPEAQEIIRDPIVLIAGGSVFGLVGYSLISKIVNYFLSKGPKVLEKKLNKYLNDENDISSSDRSDS